MIFRWKGKHFDQDTAAQQAFAFAMYSEPRQRTCAKCARCGNWLDAYYCEDGIYLISCRTCQKAALATGQNAEYAAAWTFGVCD